MFPEWEFGHNAPMGDWYGVPWEEEHKGRREEAHATEAYVGPKGSGKSALACKRNYMFHKGQIRNPDGVCYCRDPRCDAKWQVYTNLESPTLPEYGAWAKPLELSSQMMDMESEDRHIILWIDEAPQLFDSRRAMMNQVIKSSKQATMLRKKLIRMSLTAISFNWLENRMRDQCNVIYNCWSENEGRTVNAVVHRLATGDVAPWLRSQIQPEMKYWYTQDIWNKYSTNELVNMETDIMSDRTEPMVYVQDEHTGQLSALSLSEILAKVITSLVQNDRVESIHPQKLVEIIMERYHLPTSRGYLRDWLTQTGFVQNNEGEFILMTKVTA